MLLVQRHRGATLSNGHGMPCPYEIVILFRMRHERKITRLREYDYRQNGAYAITICVHERRLAFGRICDGVVRLHPFGRVATNCWLAIPSHFLGVELDEFVVMPNHVHGVLWIQNEAPPTPQQEIEIRQFGQPQSDSLGTVIGAFKSAVTKEIGRQRSNKTEVWQRGFYDHIIRNDHDLELQRQYIRDNPAKWEEDEHFRRG
jgi:REP element-mobilizing transposase RayT